MNILIKKLLFGILALALVLSPVFAQGLGCTNPTAGDGETICDPSDSDYMWSCNTGAWSSTFCPLGCNPTTQMCNGMQNGESCTTEWETRCHPNDADAIQRCENDGTGNLEWNYYMACNGLMCDPATNACFECSTSLYSPYCVGDVSNYCDAGYIASENCANLIGGYCDAATGLCDSNIINASTCTAAELGNTRCKPLESPSVTIEICIEISPNVYQWTGDMMCNPTDSQGRALGCYEGALIGSAYCKQCAVPGERACWFSDSWYQCEIDYTYSIPTYCAATEVCLDGFCNPTNNTNGTVSCTLGEERCNNNVIEKCKNVSNSIDFFVDRACAGNEYCEEIGTNPTLAVCRAITSGGGSATAPGGYSSGGGVGSGGGEVFRDNVDCASYTTWQISGASQFINSNGEQCTNTTVVRYCITSDGKTDTSRTETDYSIDCVQSDKCDYIYDRTEKFVDETEEGLCRNCERELYVYTCQPSGQTDFSNIKESITCGDYSKCEAKFPTANVADEKGWIDNLLADWGVALGIIFLLLIALIAFVAYKMSEDDEDGQQELK